MGLTLGSLESQDTRAMQGHRCDHVSQWSRGSLRRSQTTATRAEVCALMEFQVITTSVLPQTRVGE